MVKENVTAIFLGPIRNLRGLSLMEVGSISDKNWPNYLNNITKFGRSPWCAFIPTILSNPQSHLGNLPDVITNQGTYRNTYFPV